MGLQRRLLLHTPQLRLGPVARRVPSSPCSEKQSARSGGFLGLTTAERTELTQLRRENRQLKLEREILSNAAAWFAQETAPNTKRSSGS